MMTDPAAERSPPLVNTDTAVPLTDEVPYLPSESAVDSARPAAYTRGYASVIPTQTPSMKETMKGSEAGETTLDPRRASIDDDEDDEDDGDEDEDNDEPEQYDGRGKMKDLTASEVDIAPGLKRQHWW
jgi:hypothetical protein